MVQRECKQRSRPAVLPFKTGWLLVARDSRHRLELSSQEILVRTIPNHQPIVFFNTFGIVVVGNILSHHIPMKHVRLTILLFASFPYYGLS